MFNFNNITPHEFELLTKDIMQKKLGFELRTYAQGRDGGVDIRGFTGNDIIIQGKHYIKSSFANLRTSLEKELEKIKKLNPKRYIIVTSFALTPSNEDEIYEMFKDFMLDKKDILDINVLNSYLENNEYVDILKIHYKLWLTSTNMLDIIFNKELDFDSNSFMQDYNAKASLFVFSKAYSEALNILKHNNILIIDGAPGVGKTTLSKLLVANFCKQEYIFRYASSNSISEIKKGITATKKEIILMDNFLGQRVTDLSNHFFEEFKILIDFASANENKKIILNSRSIVLKEAVSTKQSFKDLLEYYKICTYEIKVEELTYLERSQILYNHIYFNELPSLYMDAIKHDKHYLDIVKHKNFSPRIVEYVTRDAIVSKMDSGKYFSYIIETLNNPKDIWKDEFLNLSKAEKLFIFSMYTLISFDRLDGEFVSSTILRECFECSLSKEHDIDSTINYYENIMEKLAGGLIKINISNNKMSAGFINPSVEDYIHESLSKLDLEMQKIAESAIYLEQLINLKKLNTTSLKNIITQIIEDKKFLSLKKYTNLRENYHYLRFIFDYDCKFHNLKEHVYELFNTLKAFSNEREDNANLIMDFFFEKGMYNFFELHNLLHNDSLVEKIFEYLNFEQIIKFLRLYEGALNLSNDLVLSSQFADKFSFLISWEIEFDIIHNCKGRLGKGIIELRASFNDFENLTEEEFNQLYKDTKKLFTTEYIMPLIEERKKALKFSTIIDHLNVSIKNILDEISFHDALIWDSHEINDLETRQTDILDNNYEAIVNLFGAEYPSIDYTSDYI